MASPNKRGDEWVTYELADGEDIYGEYAWVTDTHYFDDVDEPTVVLRKTWQLVDVEQITFGEREPDDDEDHEETVAP